MSNSGEFNRTYQEDTITYEVTISYGTDSISTSYEVSVAGFKALTNIASTYIGGNSSSYESLNSDIFTICDIITCGFAFPASDGTFTESSVNGYNFTYYLPKMAEYVIPNAHAEGTYVVLSIAGVDTAYDTAFETICSNDELIDTFVTNIVGLINTYGFDGVDIDWEVPSDGSLFTKLMTKLYTAVKENNENHLVTAAIGGGSWQPQNYDLTNSSKYLDYINLMTYNMSTASGYHHTALYASNNYDNDTNAVAKTLTSCSVDESIAIYNNYGVDNSKIIIGSGFYGIVQTRTSTNAAWTYLTNPSYTTIKNDYLTDSSFSSYYDETCQVPYLISNDGLTFVTYENARSVAAKCEYAINNNLAGVFAWHCNFDDGDLFNAFKDSLSK